MVDREELADEFRFQAEWRRQKAAEYPDDKRNLEAAEILSRLAETVALCPEEVIVAFQEIWQDEENYNFAEMWAENLRQVGFVSDPKSAEEMYRQMISEYAGL